MSHPGNLVCSQAQHEEWQLEILLHLEKVGEVLGGPVSGSLKWRPATVRLWAALRPGAHPWPTHGVLEYIAVIQAIHELESAGFIECQRELGGQQEFTKITLVM